MVRTSLFNQPQRFCPLSQPVAYLCQFCRAHPTLCIILFLPSIKRVKQPARSAMGVPRLGGSKDVLEHRIIFRFRDRLSFREVSGVVSQVKSDLHPVEVRRNELGA